MSNWAENVMKDIQDSSLGSCDTFSFSCKMCGSCCRNRGNEAIILSGLDVYRVSKALDVEPFEMIEKNCGMYIGADSHLSILYLKERDDGSCRLLRKGLCTVQDSKPVVCAIHPLGRYYSVEDDKIHYFLTESCPQGRENGKVWTLNEWLDNFGIRGLDDMSKAWFRTSMDVAAVTCKVERERIPADVYVEIFKAFYIDYDVKQPFTEQLLANVGRLDEVLEQLKIK